MIVLAAVALVTSGLLAGLLATRPWLAPWGVVFLFGTTSELRLRVSDLLGVSKDAYVALLVGITVLAVLRGQTSLLARIPPATVWFPLAALVGLYVLDLGGTHGASWFFGTRLLVEPLLLLVVGLATPQPQRALRHLVLALCWFMPAQAVLAWVQQAVGPEALVYEWGYAFGTQVRLSSGGTLRAPGSFEEAFALAAQAVLAACVAATVAGRGQAALLWVSTVAVLGATQVRTAVLQLAAIVLVVLVRRGKVLAATVGVVGAVAGALLVAGVFLTSSTVPGGPVRPLLFTLNGRFDAWAVAYEGVHTLVRGNGVGAVGAGSTRAQGGLVSEGPRYDPNQESAALFAGNPAFIDSSWGQVLSDVGLPGVLALLAWVVAYAWWLRGPAGSGSGPAWLVLAVLAVSVLDWISRTTLASYPTGFTTLYMLGLATGAMLAGSARSVGTLSTRGLHDRAGA